MEQNDKLILKRDSDKFIYNLIFQEDDVSWQSVIYELAREGKIDPWDIDISILAQEYLTMIRRLKEMNFRLSGKVILAAAILLKMKAEHIGLEQLLMLTNPEQFTQEIEEEASYEFEKHFTKAKLDARIPIPRKRKVTIFELVDALKRAIEVDERRRRRWLELRPAMAPHIEVKKVDIFGKIEFVFNRLKALVRKFKKSIISFEELLPSKERCDIIWTLVPLLHLATQGKLELKQQEAFGPIFIKTSEKELGKGLTREVFEKSLEKEDGKR
ncbi:MAG: segregation/condensation protein A [Candidatus Nanoarchaeia archaeon]